MSGHGGPWSRCLPRDEQQIMKALREALKPGNPASVRREAAMHLLNANMEKDDEAATVLRQLLQDKHLTPEVRAETARALATVGTQIKWARPLLIEALSDDSALMRQSAAQALVNAGGPEAATALSARLEDKEALVRINAAAALLANGAKSDKVLEVLQAGLRSADGGVVKHMFLLAALRKGSLTPGIEPQPWKNWFWIIPATMIRALPAAICFAFGKDEESL